MESSFMNLIRGSRLSSHMGLTMSEGIPYKFSRDYLYVEIPIVGFLESPLSQEEPMKEMKRNQHMWIVPACTVDTKGQFITEVEPNHLLAEYGQVQAGYKIHPGSGKMTPGFWFTSRKDLDISKVDWAVRIYMRG